MNIVEMIPLKKINILNARARSRIQFREIVENISLVGLKKPITVSRREMDDQFDLVCGQGRLEAYAASGETEIPAMVVSISLHERLLHSLVENLTRRKPQSIEFARDLLSLKNRGHSTSEIALMTGVSDTTVSDLIRLVENGEERLLNAVNKGDVPLYVAIEIAASSDEEIQIKLQEAYDSGQLRGKALIKLRRLLEERKILGKKVANHRTRSNGGSTTHDLIRKIQRDAEKQKILLRKASRCEQNLRFLTSALKVLFGNDHFITLLRAEQLDTLPKYVDEMIKK